MCRWLFFFSSRRRHTRYIGDWSSDVCSSDLRLSLSPKHTSDFRRSGSVRKYVWVRAKVGTAALAGGIITPVVTWAHPRSEERRVGKEWRCRGWRYPEERHV